MTKILRLFAVLLVVITGSTASQAQIFYSATSPDGKTISYLFGTHHLAPVSMLDSVPGLSDALNACETIVGEIDMTEGITEMAFKIAPLAVAPADSTLTKLYSPEEFAKLDSCYQQMTGLPISLKMMDKVKPIVIVQQATAAITQKTFPQLSVEDQLDLYFQKTAKELGKKVEGLETMEMQANLLFNIPMNQQADMLREVLENPEESIKQITELNEAYSKRDAEALLKISLEQMGSNGDFSDQLLRIRNENWMKVLPDMLCSHPTFIVVGALHLLGNDGILTALEKEGFKIKPIY